jgi:hypothetical protein
MLEGRPKQNFLSQQFTALASAKLTEPLKRKARFMKPDLIPEAVLDSDSEKSEMTATKL